MKKLYKRSGFWNIIYLILFYLSTTLTILFVYFAMHAWKWVSFKVDFINRVLMNDNSALGKNFLLVLAVFFVLNTLYLIRIKK